MALTALLISGATSSSFPWVSTGSSGDPKTSAPSTPERRTRAAQAEPNLRHDAKFTRVTIEQGLSDQRVQAIVQDRAGFIWFGTNNGLNRYDGYSVVAFRNDPMDPYSLSNNVVTSLYEDGSGTLWVGTRSGLNAFDPRTKRFTRYLHDPSDARSLSHNAVLTINADHSGIFCFGPWGGGINRFDPRPGHSLLIATTRPTRAA